MVEGLHAAGQCGAFLVSSSLCRMARPASLSSHRKCLNTPSCSITCTLPPTCTRLLLDGGEEALRVEEAAHPEALGPPAVQPAVQLLVPHQQARKPAAAAAGLPAAVAEADGGGQVSGRTQALSSTM